MASLYVFLYAKCCICDIFFITIILRDFYEPDRNFYEPDCNLNEPDSNFYEQDQHFYEPDTKMSSFKKKKKSMLKSDIPDMIPEKKHFFGYGPFNKVRVSFDGLQYLLYC